MWNYPPIVSYVLEGAILLGGLAVYLGATKGTTSVGKYGIIILVVALFGLNAVSTFMEPPSDYRFLVASTFIINLIIIGVASWLDTKRT